MINENVKWTFREKIFNPEEHNRIVGIQEKDLEVKKLTENWQSWFLEWRKEGTQHSLKAKALSDISSANISLCLEIKTWYPSCYLLAPGAVYNGNRFVTRKTPYSPKLERSEDISANVPVIISDVPRLNIEEGCSSLYDRSGSFSMPVIIIFYPEEQQALRISFNKRNAFGDMGILIKENDSRNALSVCFESPVVRPLTKYRITDNAVPSDDVPADFLENDIVSFDVNTVLFRCKNIETLMVNFFEENWRSPTFNHAGQLPFSKAFRIIEKKYNQSNWVEHPGYYSVGMRNGKHPFLQDWQIGWTGGMISTLPLLARGNKLSQERVLQMFDWLFPAGIAPSGFFWDSGEKGTKWYGGDIRREHTQNWHLVRKSGDGLFYVLKHFNLLNRKDYKLKTIWLEGTKGVANAFVKLWRKHGQYGQFVHSITGEIVVGNSTSGAIVPAALVLAWQQFGEDEYLSCAKESAAFLYENFVANGYTCGGPGDALQNPDSESAYAMVESLTLLYQQTRDQIWLERARVATGLFSTWVMSYDYQFPESSLFGKLNLHTFGTVFANTQNKHAAPGICTYSGSALLTLYRLTGDLIYLNLLRAITQNLTQYLSYEGHQINGLQSGWVSERINTTDWLEGIGETMAGSTWAEVSLMLTWLEIPAVYIDVEKQTCFCFDQCDALPDWESNQVIIRNNYGETSDFMIIIDRHQGVYEEVVQIEKEAEFSVK